MTSITPIYLPYYVLIDCCMPTCTCTHAKLSKMSIFLGQILNPKTPFFLGRREYENCSMKGWYHLLLVCEDECRGLSPPAVNFLDYVLGLGRCAKRGHKDLYWFEPPESNTLRPV
jgi:hypothetical protein